MADGDEQRRRQHDVTGGASKGKGRDTNDEGKQSEPRQEQSSSSSSRSLLGSALSGLGREASSSLSGLVSSQSKAGPARSSAATAGASSSSATWSADQRSQAPGGAQRDTTGPRQGFRTTAASPPPLRDLYSNPSPRFSNLESLDQGLHELVRSQQQQSSGETGVLASQTHQGSEATPAELLDPAYHEAWARSIPAADLSSTAIAPPSNDATSASLAEAWDRAMPTDSAPPPRAPTAEEPGGFMALLAAEEEAELQEMMRPFDPQRAQQENLEFALPPRDLQAASAAGPSAGPDSAQALPYFLQEDWKQRAASDLAALRARLEGGADEAGAGRDRRRVLRLVERDLALLESRLGYAEEVWLNEAKEGPPEEADLLNDEDDDDGGDQAEADAEKELDERRHRALERLDSLRRHLAAKL